MCKRFFAVTLLLVLLIALLPAPVRAEEPIGAALDFANSDMEASGDGVCWYVDTMRGKRLTASRAATEAELREESCNGEFVIRPLTDFPVDQLLYWEGRLLVSAGKRLMTLEPESGKLLSERVFAAPVERFAVSGAGLWVLSGGELLLLNGGIERRLVSGAARFWLEDGDRLCYMRGEETVCTLRLSTGALTEAPNRSSSLEEQPGDESCGMGLNALKQKFPHGKYWNHMPKKGTGMAYNNQDGWTNLPCTRHNNYCGTSLQTCNGYAPCGEELSYQCWGFADKLGHDLSGCDPSLCDQGNGWRKLLTASALDELKAGDIIRYNKGGSIYHSIYVTGVDGDTVTYADCNYDGSCVIRWGQTVSKSTVRRGFVFMRSAPAAAGWEPSYLLEVNACLDGEPGGSTAGWASFDVWINGEPWQTGVSDFQGDLVRDTQYEIRNVQPVSGVMFDESAGSALSGSLSADSELILTLDHYWLNSAGEKVKTTLTDLPDPSKWSYRPICWALENGVSSSLSSTRFGPGEHCSRAQAMTFLWVLSGRPAPETEALPFEDVKPDAYYSSAVRWAVEQGITAGKTPGRFRPRDDCSRAEVLTFLWSLAGRPAPAALAEAEGEPLPNLSPFSDVRPGHYFYTPVLWAVEKGITAGTAPDTFSPKRACTRAEILAFLCTYWRER